MATTRTERDQSDAVTPPDEKFWKRYSPRHELELSTAISVGAHAGVIGIMVLTAWWVLAKHGDEESRPPTMDVVQVAGGGGFDGLGGGSGAIGKPDPTRGSEPREFIEKPGPATPSGKLPPNDLKLQDPEKPSLTLPDIPETALLDPSVLAALDETGKQADELVRKMMKLPKASAAGSEGGKDEGKDGGKKGGGTPGAGQGNKGAGQGAGGPGRDATKQEILAWRWRFDLSGGGKEHARKLDAAGVILAVPDGRGGALIVRNLKRRPVEALPENLEPFQEAVKWYNTKPESIRNLARELRLSFVPQFLVLLLPKDREEKMALHEETHAKQQGRDPRDISGTWFDFRLQNGAYEPVVIRQEYAK